MSVGPDVVSILNSWWGGGYQCDESLASIAQASNLVFGGNPLYQVSDFLAVYPKFGTQPQGMLIVVPDPVTPGSGYVVNDQLTVVQPDAQNGLVQVAAVGAGGVPTAYTVVTPGTGYQTTPIVNAIAAATLFDGGQGYVVGDVVVPLQPNAGDAALQVTSIGVLGTVTGFTLIQGGTGYAAQGEVVCAGGHGTGLLINITGITIYVGSGTTGGTGNSALVDVTQITAPNLVCIPPAVLQMYVNLASSQLSINRWGQGQWQIAMAWFIAHYATLYLRSEGSYGSTPGQVAASGLTRGIMVSKSAGNVSATIKVPEGLEEWGSFLLTEYGLQLITMARVVGMGCVYAW